MQVKKLLIIAPSRKMGGIERALSVIANEWAKQNFTVTYVSCLKSEPFYALNPNIKVVEPDFKRSGGIANKIFFYPKLIKYLRKQIKNEKPDRVLSFGDMFNPLVLIAAKGLKIPVYISDRTSADYKFPKYISILKQQMYPKAAGFIAQTPRAYDAKVLQFGKKFRQTIIPNAIREISGNNVQKEKIILYVGRFAWEKNPIALIEAFSRIENKGDWKLVMAGDGPQLQDMKTKASTLGLENKIDFLGSISDVDTWLKRSSIFVLPSVVEGFPNALCEAMASGLPCICFDSIAYESIISPNQDGIVIPSGEIKTLALKLKGLMHNEEKRNRLGESASRKSKTWKVEVVIEQFNKFMKLKNEES